MIDSIGVGIALGLGAGLSPGPLLSLVVLSSLRDGIAAGCRLACAPLLTDLPIVLIALTLLSTSPRSLVTVLSMLGGAVVIGFGVMSLREARTSSTGGSAAQGGAAEGERGRHYLRRSVIVNALSPHPWVFWIGVGAPLMVSSAQNGILHSGAFVIGFYTLLVGSKMVIAVMVSASGRRLGPHATQIMAMAASLLMIVTGVLLMLSALR